MSAAWLVVVAAWAVLPALARKHQRPAGGWPAPRRCCWYAAALLLTLAVEPPLGPAAQRSPGAQAVQFGVLAFWVVPLAVLGWPRAPGRRLAWPGIRTPTRDAVAAWACFLAVTIGWRVPPAVDLVASGRAWLALEAVTVVGGNWWLWTILAGASHPALAQPRPRRIALAAGAAWSVWIFAYVVGFSAHPFYPAFAVAAAPMAAQQLVVGGLLVTSGLAFVPVCFVNLTRWLTTDQAEAEAELARYRARAAGGGSRPGPSGSGRD